LRRLTHISEVLELTPECNYQLQDLFRFVPASDSGPRRVTGKLERTGAKPTFNDAPYVNGLDDIINLTKSMWTKQRAKK